MDVVLQVEGRLCAGLVVAWAPWLFGASASAAAAAALDLSPWCIKCSQNVVFIGRRSWQLQTMPQAHEEPVASVKLLVFLGGSHRALVCYSRSSVGCFLEQRRDRITHFQTRCGAANSSRDLYARRRDRCGHWNAALVPAGEGPAQAYDKRDGPDGLRLRPPRGLRREAARL